MKRILLLLFLTLAAAAPSHAKGDANAVKGLVADRCTGCHEVPGYSSEGLPTLEAPPFQVIADTPEKYTDKRIRKFLAKPHWPMQQFILSRSDIDNLVAFFASLRQP